MTQRFRKQGRLVYLREKATEHYWDEHWSKQDAENLFKQFETGKLGELEKTYKTWLPKEGRILEGGCGLGQFVLSLQKHGYQIEGIDFAKDTIDKVKEFFPDLPIYFGDLTQLDIPENYYAGYISHGVIEHDVNGPDKFIVECKRILQNDGIAIFTIPYFNTIRRIKYSRESGREIPEDQFYQYAYPHQELIEIFESYGFEILEQSYFSPVKGLKDELPLLNTLLNIRGIGWRMYKLIIATGNFLPFVKRHVCHMQYFVLKNHK